jgi:cellulose synthase/poly-beta-1,6-N-acetylglucosamine synthase-like glycosyltransferase
MGTGMAFPWHVIRDAPSLGSHLAEDIQLGIELASLGFAPIYCPGAHIKSPSPHEASAARRQRRRWEHGHISTLIDRAPRVIARGIALRKPHVLTMGLDVLVPPLALFVVVLLINILATLLFWQESGWWAPVAVASSALGFVLTAVFVAWVKYGRATLPARHLLMIPIYIFWKLPLYLSFSVRGPYTTWERAERSPSGF